MMPGRVDWWNDMGFCEMTMRRLFVASTFHCATYCIARASVARRNEWISGALFSLEDEGRG
jgi:hypothetical protein